MWLFSESTSYQTRDAIPTGKKNKGIFFYLKVQLPILKLKGNIDQNYLGQFW